MKWRNALLVILCSCGGLLSGPAAQAQALKATGGTGAYKQDIWWLNFQGISVAAGGTTTRSFTIGDVTINVIIDNVSFSGQVATSTPTVLSGVRLSGYRPGTWTGDGLDEVYNIGGTGTNNTLTNALSTNLRGNGSNTGPVSSMLTTNFRIRAYATINGVATDLGLIFATGEEDSGQSEYERVTTNGSTWQLLEKVVPNIDGRKRITFSNNNRTAELRASGGNVALLYTQKQATSSTNPLQGDATFVSTGKTAIALGVIISSDFGDAPASYNNAVNIFPPSITGGNPKNPDNAATYHNWLSEGGTYGPGNAGTIVGPAAGYIIDAGTLEDAPFPKLGTLPGDGDLNSFMSTTATGDNTSDTNDEDAFPSSPPAVDLRTATYAVTVPAAKNTSNAATPAYVMAWVDFNRDGIFSPSEYTTASFTANNTTVTVPLAWTLPAARNAGPSYARFRISDTSPASLADNTTTAIDERSYLTLGNGETEDYVVQLAAANLISGNVYNDLNGLTDNTVNGSGTNAGGLNAVLVDASGNVVATVPVNADGTYAFSNVPNATYSLRITTATATVGAAAPAVSLPAGWVSTGENTGTAADSDGTPNGIIASVTIDNATPVSSLNFGIEQGPVTQAVTSSNNVQGSAVTVTPNATDASGGTVDLTRVSLVAPSGVTPTTDAQGDVTGFTVVGQGTWSVNPTTGAITFTPQAGFTGSPTPVSYTVRDNAGVISNASPVNITYVPPVSISGKVFNDTDGPANGINNLTAGTNAGGLNAVLIDAAGNVAAMAAVAADGTYTFSNVTPGVPYTVQLTTATATVGTPAPAVALPAGWASTGESNGITATTDGTADGISAAFTPTANTTDINFGIEQVPVASPQTKSVAGQPVSGQSISLSDAPLQGSDATDQPTAGSWSGKSVTITSLPTNGFELLYNGSPVTAGQAIANYDPALLAIRPTAATPLGAAQTTFGYAITDAAGQTSAATTYTVSFTQALPVTLVAFSGTYQAGKGNILSWSTAAEKNNAFFAIERSTDAQLFETIGKVAGMGTTTARNAYVFTDASPAAGTCYYRLRQVDADGTYRYSRTIAVRSAAAAPGLRLYPNPVVAELNYEAEGHVQSVQVRTLSGSVVLTGQAGQRLDVSRLPAGMYLMEVQTAEGQRLRQSFIKQ